MSDGLSDEDIIRAIVEEPRFAAVLILNLRRDVYRLQVDLMQLQHDPGREVKP